MDGNYVSSVNFELIMKTPLIEENLNSQLNFLQTKYIEFNKIFEEVKDFNDNVNKMPYTEYIKTKGQM
jgi:hypothetical protein